MEHRTKWKVNTEDVRELIKSGSNICWKGLKFGEKCDTFRGVVEGVAKSPRTGEKNLPPSGFDHEALSGQTIQTQDGSVLTWQQELPGEAGGTKLKWNKPGSPGRDSTARGGSQARARGFSSRDVREN